MCSFVHRLCTVCCMLFLWTVSADRMAAWGNLVVLLADPQTIVQYCIEGL